MKRRLAMLAGAAMLSTIGMLAPSPASANAPTDACAGAGTAFLTLGLAYPPFDLDGNLVGFFFRFDTGTCATKGTNLSASGHVHGWCGHSTGSGTTNNGADFHFVSAGGTLVIFGHLVGSVEAAPALGTGSCTDKTADTFTIAGAVVLQGAALTGLPPTWNPLG